MRIGKYVGVAGLIALTGIVCFLIYDHDNEAAFEAKLALAREFYNSGQPESLDQLRTLTEDLLGGFASRRHTEDFVRFYEETQYYLALGDHVSNKAGKVRAYNLGAETALQQFVLLFPDSTKIQHVLQSYVRHLIYSQGNFSHGQTRSDRLLSALTDHSAKGDKGAMNSSDDWKEQFFSTGIVDQSRSFFGRKLDQQVGLRFNAFISKLRDTKPALVQWLVKFAKNEARRTFIGDQNHDAFVSLTGGRILRPLCRYPHVSLLYNWIESWHQNIPGENGAMIFGDTHKQAKDLEEIRYLICNPTADKVGTGKFCSYQSAGTRPIAASFERKIWYNRYSVIDLKTKEKAVMEIPATVDDGCPPELTVVERNWPGEIIGRTIERKELERAKIYWMEQFRSDRQEIVRYPLKPGENTAYGITVERAGDGSGVVVRDVTPDEVLDTRELRIGDVVTAIPTRKEIQGVKMTDEKTFVKVMYDQARLEYGKVRVHTIRDGKGRSVSMYLRKRRP